MRQPLLTQDPCYFPIIASQTILDAEKIVFSFTQRLWSFQNLYPIAYLQLFLSAQPPLSAIICLSQFVLFLLKLDISVNSAIVIILFFHTISQLMRISAIRLSLKRTGKCCDAVYGQVFCTAVRPAFFSELRMSMSYHFSMI